MSPSTIRVYTRFRVLTFLFVLLALAVGPTIKAQTNQQTNSQLRLAQDFERRGNYNSALRMYLRLYEQVPSNQIYYEGVKRNMLRLEMYDEVLTIIDEQVQRTDDPRYHADLGNVYYKQGNHQQAFQIWNDIIQENPENRAVYPYVANAMISNRLYDEAIDIYKLARANLNNNEIYVFELGNLYAIRLNYEAATQEYLNYLARHPNQFGYIEGRIASYTREPEQANKVAELLRENLENTKQQYLIRKLLADLYLRVEEYERSLQQFIILEAMDDPLPQQKKTHGQELYFFADKALRAGEFGFAQQAFDLILMNYENSPFRLRALFGLALCRQKQGLADEAIESYQSLIDFAPNSPEAQEALFQIGEIYYSSLFDIDKALRTFRNLTQRYTGSPKTIEAFFRIGDCYAAVGKFKDAKDWYAKPLRIQNPTWVVQDRSLYKSAYVDFLQDEYDSALQQLNKITENMAEKNSVEENYVNDALELIILIEENRKDSEAALQKYGAAQKLKLQRKYSEAIAELQAILKNHPKAAILDDSLLELGELERVRGNYTDALDYFKQLLADHSESVYAALAQKRIGEIYEQGLGDAQKAYEAYERLLIDHPSSPYLEEVRQKLRNLQSLQLNN